MESAIRVRNLFLTLLTLVSLCWMNIGLADDIPEMTESVATVNINEDNAEKLAEVLVGVGLSRAEAIVAYREAHGRFYSAEELTAVRGIGESTVMKNQDKIRVE